MQKGFTRPCRYAYVFLKSHLSIILITTNQPFRALTLEAGRVGGRGEDFTAAVSEVGHCDVLTGSRDQGHNPHPYHGVSLWGRYVGHQTGICEDLWEITVHSHLSKSPPLTRLFWQIQIFIFMWYTCGVSFEIYIDLALFLRVIPPGITRSCCWSCVEVATKKKGK